MPGAAADKGWTDRDESRWPVPYWYIDTGFTALLILLAVVDEGLGERHRARIDWWGNITFAVGVVTSRERRTASLHVRTRARR